jgi:hypothetical protein
MRAVASFIAGLVVAVSLPVIAQEIPFPDVEADASYGDAVQEMMRQGVLQGYDSGWFGPLDPVTRAQIAIILQRYDRRMIDPLRERIERLEREVGIDQGGNSCPDGYQVGESFPSPDGCNTCTCTRNGAACTKRACAPQTKCLSSDDCSRGDYCTTEEGDCQSACPPGAEVCIQVCAGVCKPRSTGGECEPIRCADGSTHPSCTKDGHPINYFADPCMNSSSRSSSRSSLRSSRSSSSARSSVRSSTRSRSSTAAVSCQNELENYKETVEENDSCTNDSDCTIFMASCPFVTCGVGINTGGNSEVYRAAQAYQRCKDASGEPLPCAMCIQMEARCVQGRCVAEQT